jgi:aspartyl-tRNA(Asn)/glutamyl-tRNA(Gln) amidotransferase subunit A
MMLGAYALSAGYYDAYYAKAQKVRTLIVEDFKKVFEEVDLIIGPVMPTTAMKLGESANSVAFGEIADLFQEPSSIAGLCAVSLPCGLSDGLPVAFQLIGNYLDEQKLIDASATFQEHTNFHKSFPDMEAK